MATLGQLKQALQQADQAGNTEDAKKIADAIRRTQGRNQELREGQGPAQPAEDLPEFGGLEQFGPTGEQAGTGARLGAAFATTPDVDQRKDIIKTAIPGTSFSEDEDGNTVIELPDGERAYLNRPGLSMQDFADFTSDVVKFLPAAKFAAGGKSLLTRLGRGFIGGSATSATEDAAASAQGSEQGFDIGKAGTTGAIDAGAEAVAPALGLMGRVFRRTFGRRTGEIFRDGQLTPKARKALGRAGIDPEKVSPEMAESAIRMSEQGAPKESALGVAQSQRFGFPLTRGQTTDDFTQIAMEEEFRGRGDAAGEMMRAFDKRQNERALEINREIQEDLGGRGRAIDSEAEAGARLGSEVRSQAEELQLAIDDAFDAVRGTEASINREGLDRLADAADVIRQESIPADPDLTPATIKAIERIKTLSGNDLNAQTLNQVEETRRVLNNLQGAAKNATDRKGVTLIKRRYDQYLDEAFDNALFSGDEQALETLKKARGLRAEYGSRFQENKGRTKSGRRTPDPGGRAIESIVENNATDEGVVNMLFGRSKLFDSENAVKSIRSLRQATDNSEEVNNTLKQLTFRRISSQAIDDGQFSARKFTKAFDRAMKDNPAVMREVFSRDELQAIKEFRDAAGRTITPDKARNPSGTANALIRSLGRVGAVIGLQKGGIGMGALTGSAFRSGGKFIERQAARGQVEEAINPQFLLPGRPNAAVISSTISGMRHGGETAVQEGAELLSGQTSGPQERNGSPAPQGGPQAP